MQGGAAQFPGWAAPFFMELIMPSESKIDELAEAPSRVRTDEGEVQERPIADLIRGDQYARQKATAVNSVPWGMRIARTKPGGTV